MKNKAQKKDEKKIQEISDLGENIRGALCYILGFLSGIFFLATEKENKFVRFHAIQSIMVSLGLILFTMIPILGWIFAVLIVPFSIIIGLFLMYKAYLGIKFKLLIIGDLAERQAEKSGKK